MSFVALTLNQVIDYVSNRVNSPIICHSKHEINTRHFVCLWGAKISLVFTFTASLRRQWIQKEAEVEQEDDAEEPQSKRLKLDEVKPELFFLLHISPPSVPSVLSERSSGASFSRQFRSVGGVVAGRHLGSPCRGKDRSGEWRTRGWKD